MTQEFEPTRIFRIYGVVQGVGFRPFVSRLADRFCLRGSVANKGSYVEVHAQGGTDELAAFREALEKEAPPRSAILKIDERSGPEAPYREFLIIESARETGDIFVSPDIATCPECRRELFDPADRRYRHPFINCTACGPRLTILDAMPYDRERTSMGHFPMCRQCEYEYTHAETRRYDAQPVCCRDCGPEVYLIGHPERSDAAITAVRRAIMEGKIVAVKGIGGFHLCCDARNAEAVCRLRKLKHRPAKPFAVMFRDLAAAAKECEVSPREADILDGHQKPIILLRRRKSSQLPEALAPGNPTLGVLLPYAPIQMLLFQFDDDTAMTDALVMTSGNVSGAPICRDDTDAKNEIAGFSDLILSHNREIRLRADDTVMDFLEDQPLMIRRSRGYAPLPFMLSGNFRGQVLGIGGELKNTFCLGKDSLFYPSPYIGDMADIRTVNALTESLRRMETLLETAPALVACDLHPNYNTVAVAEQLGLPLLRIQHHYAHILSCMAENDASGEVIGVSFDGTGYGTDGTIWGGEFFRASYTGFERLGSLRPFLLTGGDAAVREGWRIAVGMLYAMRGPESLAVLEPLALCAKREAQFQWMMADRRLNSVVSTSAGRLFDAVSALLGIRRISTFEGEASMALQFAAEAWSAAHPGEEGTRLGCFVECGKTQFFQLATEKLFDQLADCRLAGTDPGELAYAFHAALADGIAAGCGKIRDWTGLGVCALSGGVFQNRLLTVLVLERLRKMGFQVLRHSLIPPNDGGIALGQAVAAMVKLNSK